MKPIFVPLDENYYRLIPDEAKPRICSDTKGIVALDEEKDYEMVAVAVMDTWSHNACQIHLWIGNPYILRHGFSEEVCGFIFGEGSGRELIIGVTPSDNKAALKFNVHMGMVEQYRIEDGYAKGVDYVITTMKKQDCRWIDQPATPVELELVAGEFNG